MRSKRAVAGQLPVIVLVVTILTILVNVRNVYAQTLTLTPDPVTQGTDVVATGSGHITSATGSLFVSTIFVAGLVSSCSGSVLFRMAASTDAGGNLNPVTIPTASLPVGTYCVQVSFFPGRKGTQATASLTVNPASIPEYPYGIPLLALFMILLYTVIKYKVRN